MTEFTMRVAGVAVAVSATMTSTRDFCSEYLCNAAPDFAIRITPEDIAYEREKSAREDARAGITPRNFSDAYLETIAVQRKLAEQLLSIDTLLFHGSVVAVDGIGYLFTAKSGTGKSTHARLWREAFGDRAVMINDDKPFLRMSGAGVMACGSPWNGKHRLGTNACVSLRAICLLQRGEKNEISPISAQEAVVELLQQSNWPMDMGLMPQYLALIDRLAKHVRFYRMACNMDPEAAWMAYEAMAQGQKEDAE